MAEKDPNETGVIIGSVIGTLAFIALVVFAYYVIKNYIRVKYNYNAVEHSLDEEEIEFKKIIEMQSDDIEELFDIPDDDVDFDVKEKDRLSMLENYRRNLVATASSSQAAVDEDNLRL